MSPSFGASSQLINSVVEVRVKTFLGTALMLVLSQMIPARLRLIKVVLADFVKLPFSFMWVKKNRSPIILLSNWLTVMKKNNMFRSVSKIKAKHNCKHYFEIFLQKRGYLQVKAHFHFPVWTLLLTEALSLLWLMIKLKLIFKFVIEKLDCKAAIKTFCNYSLYKLTEDFL